MPHFEGDESRGAATLPTGRPTNQPTSKNHSNANTNGNDRLQAVKSIYLPYGRAFCTHASAVASFSVAVTLL